MTAPANPGATSSARAPLFTLGSALGWLGHDCPDPRCCRAPLASMQASVWFLRHGSGFCTFPLATRVLVHPLKTGDAPASVKELLCQINWCTRRDAIEVRYQPSGGTDPPVRPVPHQGPGALVVREHPTRRGDVLGAPGGDMRAITTDTSW